MLALKLSSIIRDVEKLSHIRKVDENSFEVKTKNEELHKKLSKILFDAIEKSNYKVIDLILKNNYIRAELVFDKKGFNILQHAVFNENFELFKLLFYKYYKDIECYFRDIPQLFLVVLNKKNYDFLSIFLKEPRLYSYLTKENISLLLYFLVRENQGGILKTIIEYDYIDQQIDGRCIQSILIYLVSNAKTDEFINICKNEKLFNKCEEQHLINLVALALMNKNLKILETMVENSSFLQVIMQNSKILENVVLFSKINKDIKILAIIFKHRNDIKVEQLNNKIKKLSVFEDSL